MHHRLDATTDREKSSQPQPVENCRSQRGQRSGAIAVVTLGVLMELGVADPLPALDAPAVANQLQQRSWGDSQAAEELVGCS